MRLMLGLGLLLLLSFVVTGCEDDGGGSSEPLVGPTLNGNWDGAYYIIEAKDEGRIALTATITHSGDAVTVSTTKSGTASILTGTINADGALLLIDAHDGEDWTSHFGPATESHMLIADFLVDPLSENATPLAILELWRNGGEPVGVAMALQPPSLKGME